MSIINTNKYPTNIITNNKNVYRSLSKNRSTENILQPKSNYINTIKKFYNEDVEIVRKLEFYVPPVTKLTESHNQNSLFNLKPSNKESKKSQLFGGGLDDYKNFSADENKIKLLPPDKSDQLLPLIDNSNQKYLEKKAHLKRLENLSNETKLENQLKGLKEKVAKSKSNKEYLTKRILNLQNEITENSVNIEYLKNFEKYIELSSNTINAKKLENLKNLAKKNNKEDQDAFNAKTLTLRDASKRMADIKNFEEEIERKTQEKKKLSEEVNILETKINKKTEKLENIKNKLMLHYHSLLNEGTDTRHDGLVWMIKAIWNLGSNVIISYLPNFLDEKAIEYLFETAHKEVELQKLKNLIDETKAKMKMVLKSKKNKKGNKRITLFKTDLSPSATATSMDKKTIFKEKKQTEEKYNIKKIEEFLNKKDKLDDSSLQMLKMIADLETEYNQFKDELKNARRKELSRLGREFLVNDYGRRYNTNLTTIVSAIAGEDNVNKELMRQSREQRDYFDKIKQCQNFNYILDYTNSRKVPNYIAITRKL